MSQNSLLEASSNKDVMKTCNTPSCLGFLFFSLSPTNPKWNYLGIDFTEMLILRSWGK